MTSQPVLLAAALASAALLSPAAASAQAADDCSITYGAGDALSALIAKESFASDYFDPLCPWLRSHGLELSMTSDAAELNGRSFAWVSVRLQRTANRISGTRASHTTIIRDNADEAETREALRNALDRALIALNNEREQHLQELVLEEAQAKRGG